jgi:hypothetical protein
MKNKKLTKKYQMSDILNRFSFLPLPVKSPINCQIEFRLSAAKLKARSEASPQKISNFSKLKIATKNGFVYRSKRREENRKFLRNQPDLPFVAGDRV